MISIVTPLSSTGNPFIAETYASLKAQTVKDWEWVVLQNKGGRVPAAMRGDKRIRLFREEHDGIGRLKKRACELSTGDVILELDHDDMLAPQALQRILETVKHPDLAYFVYSDFAEFIDGSWQPNTPYRPDCGWSTYPAEFNWHPLIAHESPPVTPQNLRYIDWAPNHVRAWTRTAYNSVGGHDSSFLVGDDHDLMVRMYLAGIKFDRIPECLYFYRVHERNSVKLQNSEIRQSTDRVYNRSIWALAEKFAFESGLAEVDLCGGIDCPPGYEPFDLSLGHNLDRPWPISDDSVGVLRAHDAIEHLKDPIHTMNEAYRVLAPGGFFMINVPSTNGAGAWCDPTHVSFWNRASFRYYTDRKFQRYIPEFKGRFQVSRVIEWFPDEYHRALNLSYCEAHLIALKPGYQPMGEVAI